MARAARTLAPPRGARVHRGRGRPSPGPSCRADVDISATNATGARSRTAMSPPGGRAAGRPSGGSPRSSPRRPNRVQVEQHERRRARPGGPVQAGASASSAPPGDAFATAAPARTAMTAAQASIFATLREKVAARPPARRAPRTATSGNAWSSPRRRASARPARGRSRISRRSPASRSIDREGRNVRRSDDAPRRRRRIHARPARARG